MAIDASGDGQQRIRLGRAVALLEDAHGPAALAARDDGEHREEAAYGDDREARRPLAARRGLVGRVERRREGLVDHLYRLLGHFPVAVLIRVNWVVLLVATNVLQDLIVVLPNS